MSGRAVLRSVILCEKHIEHLLSVSACSNCVCIVFKGAKITGLAPKCNLCAPAAAVPILIDACNAAGVAAEQPLPACFQNGDGCSAAEFQIPKDLRFLQAAAAFCFPRLQICLPHDGFCSAVAAAAPDDVPLSALLCRRLDSDHAGPISDFNFLFCRLNAHHFHLIQFLMLLIHNTSVAHTVLNSSVIGQDPLKNSTENRPMKKRCFIGRFVLDFSAEPSQVGYFFRQ